MARFNMKKGERFSFTKTENLNNLSVILGWEDGADLDVCAFLTGNSGLIENDADFVYFNSENREEPFNKEIHGSKSRWRSVVRPMSADGSVMGSLDERTGGNTEMMTVDLSKVSPKINEIVFCATIYDKDKGFGNVEGAYFSVVNDDNGEELCRYTLNEQFTQETALIAATLFVNDDGDWTFKAEGKGLVGGMEGLVEIYAGE